MKKKTSILGMALLAGLILPTAAWSQDGPFDGPYGSLRAGIGLLKSEGAILTGPFSETASSGLIGGSLGYRKSFGNFVFGAEGDANFYTSGSDWRYGGSGIAGLKLNGSGLAYVRVGYGKLSTDGEDLDGLILGGGYEHVFRDKMNLRLDYQNIDYTDFNFSDNIVNNTGHEITASVIFKF